MKKRKEETKKKKIKLRYKNIILFLVVIPILIYIIYKMITCNISNIYIKGNSILSDWDVIKIAKLENYPKSLKNMNTFIKSRLEKNDMIIKANVTKKGLDKVYIEIEENRALFYNSNINKTVMLDKKTLVNDLNCPYLVNYIPDTIYDSFVDSMISVDKEVLDRISEVEYKPSDIDTERFYLSMNDGNYVYINLRNFTKINNYINLLKQLKGKKGILYLDSGEYFEIK